jgi:MFS transporter, PPP family, 3-phenylpropionic acid transporter
MPALLAERGMSAEMIGLILAAGTGARLLSAPFASSLADRFGAPRVVLGSALLLSALFGCGFVLTASFAGLLLVSVLVSMTLAPINPLADALASGRTARALGAPGPGQGPGFSYGLVRGTGSAAFVGAAMIAGPVVVGAGLEMVVWANAGLLLLAAIAVAALPRCVPGNGRLIHAPREKARSEPGALRQLLAMPLFRRLLLVTGLIQGSHALYGAFATLHWQAAGIAPEAIGILWSVAVASEVVVFLFLGPWLLGRFGPTGLAALAASAGVLRWATMASTSAMPVQFLLQPLHGLTFAALHLATMRLLAETIPPRLSATAFGVQASLGPGLAGALLTLAAGPLYGNFGAGGFWAMAALCAIALPAALTLAIREDATVVEMRTASVPVLLEQDLRPATTAS